MPSKPDSDGKVIDLSRFGEQWSAGSAMGRFLGSPFVRAIILPVVLVLVAIKVLMLACFTYVGPNEYGIKVVRVPLLGARGVHKEVYGTGFHIVLKLFDLEQMYLFPKD